MSWSPPTLRQTPRFIYERVYCGQGNIENGIKELKTEVVPLSNCPNNRDHFRPCRSTARVVTRRHDRCCILSADTIVRGGCPRAPLAECADDVGARTTVNGPGVCRPERFLYKRFR